MNTHRFEVRINLGLGLILALVWLFNTPTFQVQAQGRGDVSRASLSKRDVNVDRSPTRPVAGSSSMASVGNGDFENGPDGTWTEYSALGWPLIVSSTTLLPVGVTPHSGEWAVWLGGDDNETASISQTVAITTGESTLSFWMWVGSEDACGFDFGNVLVNTTEVYSISLCTATNTNGWVNKTLDLSAYIGQNIGLQFRAETDASLNSNFFIDDVALLGPLNFVYLPVVNQNFCAFHYFDDFSNPGSGWAIGDDSQRTYGYLSGAYQILLKNQNSSYLITPDLVLPGNYQIEVDVYQPSIAQYSYGLVFGTGWNGNAYETYQFLVSPPTQEYLLEKRNMGGTWSTLIDWTSHSAINLDKSNHLRVDRVGALIRLTINGVQVNTFTDTSFTSAGRDAGLRVYSGDSAPVDTRFDNFSAICLP